MFNRNDVIDQLMERVRRYPQSSDAERVELTGLFQQQQAEWEASRGI